MSGLRKAQLEERKNKAQRIQSVMKMSGWKDIELIWREEFLENLEKLLQADDPAARGAVQALKRIFEKISDDIEWGQSALEEYRKKFVGKLSSGE
jgi:hypothetical protein